MVCRFGHGWVAPASVGGDHARRPPDDGLRLHLPNQFRRLHLQSPLGVEECLGNPREVAVRRLLLSLIVGFVAFGVVASPAFAGRSGEASGRTLAELWKAVLELPAEGNPYVTGARCFELDSGLVAPFEAGGLDLECTVRAGTGIFVVGYTWEQSAVEPPTIGGSPRQLRSFARSKVPTEPPSVLLDGTPINLRRVESPLTHVQLPPANLIQPAAQRTRFVAVGWVAPILVLRHGQHTIAITQPGSVDSDITTINVRKPRRH